jgi:hypothetical protein
MGRYDQSKSSTKKSGRYHSARAKKSKAISTPVVVILVILASAGGFYVAKQIENGWVIPDMPTLMMPFATPKEEPSKSTALDRLITESLVEPEPVTDSLEILPPMETVLILPELDSSDEWLRESLMQISPGLVQWFQGDQLVKNYVTLINDFSQGLHITKHLEFLKQAQPFIADESTAGLLMASANYQRYNTLATAIAAIDEHAAVILYRNMRPLLLHVFAEFSYPDDYSLETIFTQAAEQILAAPVIEGKIALVRHSIRYKFADPALEALNPVQKQMLRMGAENTRLIQNKVRVLLAGLTDLKTEPAPTPQ